MAFNYTNEQFQQWDEQKKIMFMSALSAGYNKIEQLIHSNTSDVTKTDIDGVIHQIEEQCESILTGNPS